MSKINVDPNIKDELQDTDWVKVGNRYIKHVYFVSSNDPKVHQISIIFPDDKIK